jgi:hypothetical protein
MGRMLNPKKKKTQYHKQHKESKEQGIGVDHADVSTAKTKFGGGDFIPMFDSLVKEYRFNHLVKEYQPVMESPPIVEESQPIKPSNEFSQSVDNIMDDILKRIRSESSPGRCNDLWKEGDW